MEYLKTIIVEDEVNSAELLLNFLHKYCPEVRVEGVAHTLDDARKLIDSTSPDLLFLDIHIGKDNAFDLFDEDQETQFQIIFTTAYDEYGLDAFKLNTIDYLLKPIDINDLQKAVKRALSRQKFFSQKILQNLKDSFLHHLNIKPNMIAVSSQKEILLIKENDIISCSANGKYTVFNFTSGNETVSSKNLGEYEKFLHLPKFFRIHKSHIINLNHLVKIDKVQGDYCVMSNGKLLPLAKRRKEELKKLLMF